jgi:sugar/nucleoside kinase (ribokinase family)
MARLGNVDVIRRICYVWPENANMPAESTPDVVCAGILVADLFVPPLDRLPAEGELIATEDFLIDSGGCAANTATALARLGQSVAVIGKVGTDPFGDFVARDLQDKGVKVEGIRISDEHGTSKTVILPVTGADRRYVHTIGANADLKVADIDRNLVRGARVFYVGGYLVLPGLSASGLAETFVYARGCGCKTVLDIVVPGGGDTKLMSDLVEILPHVDVFMPNDEEAHALTGETDSVGQARRFLELGCGIVIITMGPKGALLVTRDMVTREPAPPVEVVDESGAGDAFAAGFIVGMVEGWDMERSLQFASVIGASACTRLGCNAGIFTRAQAEQYIAGREPRMRNAVLRVGER